ncbi:hypothetical protein JCM19235_683 [Vibrio maritimus]|uniref:Uncharacterized protein n=1 Tax=Vibrio maritimus TaxID=990268 RepID=A0A090SIN9_9VIBR|nr:hypothetical protein JCM19235_683 [Vibrio maritimus]
MHKTPIKNQERLSKRSAYSRIKVGFFTLKTVPSLSVNKADINKYYGLSMYLQ